MSGYIDYLYGMPPSELPIDQLRDLILELGKDDRDLAWFLLHGGVPKAEQFIAKVYPDGDVAPDVEDNYALILGALRAYEKKSQPAGSRQRLDVIGLQSFKEDILSLAHWAYAGATEPEEEKQVEALVDQIIGLISDLGASDEPPTEDATCVTVELLAAATIDLHHWAYAGATKPEDKTGINSISDRITDHLDRLGAFDNPDA